MSTPLKLAFETVETYPGRFVPGAHLCHSGSMNSEIGY
jgi:hypothetical protein